MLTSSLTPIETDPLQEPRPKVGAVPEEMAFQHTEVEPRRISKTVRPTIGFLADFAYSEYTSRLFTGILDAAEPLGYNVQRFRLSLSKNNEETFGRCIEEGLDGVIVHDPDFRIPPQHLAKELRDHKLPYVLLDVRGFEDQLPGVSSDDQIGMRLAVEHLAQLGHKRILLCAGYDGVGSAIERVPAYHAAMKEFGRGQYAEVLWTGWNAEYLCELLLQSFRDPIVPTAVICGSDALALACMRDLQEIGTKVPRDISVVGFGNLMRTENASPTLTTVSVPYEHMGREAVTMVLEEKAKFEKDSNATPGAWRRLPTWLVTRRSTGRPPY